MNVRSFIYPGLLYLISAITILVVTTAGTGLVGSDIHLDYYYAQLRTGIDVIVTPNGTPQGSSILAYVSSWIGMYKYVYPLIYAIIPVLLYILYRKWLNPIKAFLASCLVIIFPAFFMEIPTIPRQAIAEVFLVLALLLIIRPELISNNRIRIPILIIATALVPLIHYATAAVMFVLLIIALCLSIFMRFGFSRLFFHVHMPEMRSITICFVTLIIVGGTYFATVEDGVIMNKVVTLYNQFVPEVVRIDPPYVPTIPDTFISPNTDTTAEFHLESLFRAGIGLDFFETTIPGKLFRIAQWAVIFTILIGLYKLRTNRSFWIFGLGGLFILAACVHPGWAGILNTTRFAHISLLMVAPAFVVVWNKQVTVALLGIYFFFTSGTCFELTKQTDITTLTIPYNIGLSHNRVDFGVHVYPEDIEARQYIIDNKIYPISSDMWGAYFLSEKMGYRPDINRLWPIESTYFYIRKYSSETNNLVTYQGVGLRGEMPIKNLGEFDIVYENNGAMIVKIKEETCQ